MIIYLSNYMNVEMNNIIKLGEQIKLIKKINNHDVKFNIYTNELLSINQINEQIETIYKNIFSYQEIVYNIKNSTYDYKSDKLKFKLDDPKILLEPEIHNVFDSIKEMIKSNIQQKIITGNFESIINQENPNYECKIFDNILQFIHTVNYINFNNPTILKQFSYFQDIFSFEQKYIHKINEIIISGYENQINSQQIETELDLDLTIIKMYYYDAVIFIKEQQNKLNEYGDDFIEKSENKINELKNKKIILMSWNDFYKN